MRTKYDLKSVSKHHFMQPYSKQIIFFFFSLDDNEKTFIKEHAPYLCSIPNALSKIYLAYNSYDYNSIIKFYGILKQYESLNTSESLHILLPKYLNNSFNALLS